MVAARPLTYEPERVPCRACHGTGESARVTPSCGYCGASWAQERYEAHLEAYDRGTWGILSWFIPGARNRYRWRCTLPCSHDLETWLTFTSLPCQHCRGGGTVRNMRLAEQLAGPDANRRVCQLPRRQIVAHYPPVEPIRETPPLASAPRASRAAAPITAYLRSTRHVT